MMEYMKIKDLGEIVTGNTPSKKIEEFHKSKDIPFMKPDGLDEHKISNLIYAKEYISNMAEKKARVLGRGSVLITCIGIIGKIGIIGCDKMAFNQQINAIVPDSNKIDAKYLSYILMHNKNTLQTIANAAIVPIINKTQFSEYRMYIHQDMQMQKKIASVIDKAQELIDKRKEQIAACDELIKSLFYHMFGDPVANSKKWKMVKLSEVADIKIGPFGTLLHKEEYISDGHALVNPSHIINGKICCDMNLTISEEKYSELKSYHLKKGDMILGRRGEMGRCAVVEQEGLLCGTGSLFIRSKGEVSSDILQKIISFPSYKKTIEDKAVGQTMPNLNVPIVSGFIIPRISMNAQKQYFQAVCQVDKLKSQLQQSLTELETNFNALMQRAFKGELF